MMMRVFLPDLIILAIIVWLLANVIRYIFFKDAGGGFFSLSNYWIKKDENKKGGSK